MKLVFFGHRRIAIGALRSLLTPEYRLMAVVTHHPETCPEEGPWLEEAARVAGEAGCPLLQPKRLAGSRMAEELAALGADVWVVAGYLELLTGDLLRLPRVGAINFHAALLPRYRGRAPLARALMNGERKVGATVHFIDERMDAGDIIAQSERMVRREDTVGTLYEWAVGEAPSLILRGLSAIAGDRTERRAQREEESLTYAELTPRDRLIDWAWPAERVYDQVRALTGPWPGALTHYRGEELVVWHATPPDPSDRGRGADPGRVVAVSAERGVQVQTGQGLIWITRVERNPRLGAEPAAGCVRRPGVRLGLDVETRLLRLERQVTALENRVRGHRPDPPAAAPASEARAT